MDLSFAKETNITERVRFTLSFDFFNATNSVVFADPGLSLQNPAGFGVIGGTANTPRRIQVGARFDF
jgi:hypothetical protein